MNPSEQIPKLLVIAVILGGHGLVAFRLFDGGSDAPAVKVTVPPLSPVAQAGRAAFAGHTGCEK
jgi:hypothetical protein